MPFFCGFSCMRAAVASQPVDLTICPLIPRFFYPQTHPSRFSRPSERDAACADRIQQFADVLEMSVSDLPLQLPGILRRSTDFETFLLHNEQRLSGLLSRYSLSSFDALFEILGTTAASRAMVAVFLKKPPSLDMLMNSILIASAASSMPLSTLADRVCGVLSSHLRPNLASGRFSMACAYSHPLSSLLEHLEAAEFAFLLHRIVPNMHTPPRADSTHELGHFVRQRHAGTRASDAQVAAVRAIPLEVHPLYKYMCIKFALEFFCNKVQARFRHFFGDRSVEEVSALARHFRSQTHFMDFSSWSYEGPNQRRREAGNFLGLEIEGGFSDFELYEEFLGPSSGRLEAIRTFALAAAETPRWPLVSRVLKADDVHIQFLELSLVQKNRIRPFIDGVYRAYEQSTFTEINAKFEKFPIDVLAMLLSETNEWMPAVVTACLEFVPEQWDREGKVTAFLKENSGIQGAEKLEICEICDEDFQGVVQLCAPEKNAAGHYMCSRCAGDWFRVQRKNECPFCRKVLIT